MSYTSVKLRGEDLDVSFRVTEDDPTTNAFEADWFFTDPPPWHEDLTSEELDAVMLAIGEAHFDHSYEDDLDQS